MTTSSTNFADVSNFMLGSDTLKITPFFVKALSIPGISMTHPSMPTRSGIKMFNGADTIEFDTLELEVILDAQFSTYFELLNIVMQEVDWDNDTYSPQEFDMWLVVTNSKKDDVFRLDFKNCRINSIGSLSLDPEAELGSTVAVSISYDYFRWSRKTYNSTINSAGQETKTSNTQEVKRFYDTGRYNTNPQEPSPSVF